MILNGKAKEDFLKWNNKTEEIFLHSFSDREIISLTIEWLDSVDIIINTIHEKYESLNIDTWSVWINEILLMNFNSRKEATQQALIKANDIYNERFK